MTGPAPGGPATVLFVDDEPGRLGGLMELLRAQGAQAEAVDPQDLEHDQLDGVHLISVDQFLGPDWDHYLLSPDGPSSAAARPADGVAVAAALNSALRATGQHAAVSLHTAEIDRLGAGLPREHREPLLAASHDLDWVFRFEDAAAPALAQRMTALAQAVAVLPTAWEADAPDFGTAWLGLPQDRPWTGFAVEQVEDCRPPAHGLSANTRGRSFVRWLSQRVLPYPAFLLDAAHASVLLGVDRHDLAVVGEPLARCGYEGPLAGFSGARWWRAGLQDLLYAAGTDETDPAPDRAAALGRYLGVRLAAVAGRRPVVGYTADGRQIDEPLDRDHAVRLQPDGWPVFADDAWAARSAAAADWALRALVVHADRDGLGPA